MSRKLTLAVATVLTSIILGMLFAQWWNAYMVAGGRIGIGIDEVDSGLIVTNVRPGEPADVAGVRQGDVLIAVEGQAITGFESLAETDSMWRRGVPLHVTVLRDGLPVELTPVPGASFPWFAVLTATISCLAYLALGLIAFGQSPNDLRIRLLFLFSTAVALEFALPPDIPMIPGWSAIWIVTFDLLTGIQIGLLLHLASVIPQPARWFERSRWLPAGYYSIGLVFGGATAILAVATLSGVELPAVADDIGLLLINRWVLPLWSLAVAAILAYQVTRATTTRARQQATLVLVGVLPWMAFQVLYQLFVPLDEVSPTWIDVAQPAALLVMPAAVFVAIFKFHLLDIEFVLRRSLVIILVTASLVALFSTAFGLGNVVFKAFGDSSGFSIAAMSMGMLVLGLLFAPIRRGIQRMVDRRFFPESQEMAQHLTALAAELPTLGSLPAMGRRLVEEIERVFRISNATLLVADPASGVLVTLASSSVDLDRRFGQTLLIEPDDPGLKHLERAGRPLPADQVAGSSPTLARRLHAFEAELVVGLTSGVTLAGLLLLGPKTGGERFHSSEIEMLNLFSHAAATVFENARLFESATYESLTGLMRRETIIEKLGAELQRSLRYERPLSVGMVDIDRFKRVNDSYGHLAGDALLKHVAHELKAGLRATDSIGRYGGEEFLFILPETELEEGRVVAEKLRTAIIDLASPLEEAPEARVTVSIGLAEVDLDDREGQTATKLILEADNALLEAKRTGRNRVITGPVVTA